jgi:GT2 family glycosyltransferase
VELSKACLKSLLAQTAPYATVLAVDNASTDSTPQWLRSTQALTPGIAVITFQQAESVARVWNEIMTVTEQLHLPHVLIVNNDTELLPDTYKELEWYAALNHDVGLVSCVSRRPGEDMTYDAITARPHPDFSCFLIKLSAWQAIGGFDENCIGAFYEDNCAHVELHRRGIKAVCLSIPFLHHGSATIKSADKREKQRIESNAAHNREYFFSKYGCLPGSPEYDQLFSDSTASPTPPSDNPQSPSAEHR